MAWPLREVTTLAENLSSVPSESTLVAHNYL